MCVVILLWVRKVLVLSFSELLMCRVFLMKLEVVFVFGVKFMKFGVMILYCVLLFMGISVVLE